MKYFNGNEVVIGWKATALSTLIAVGLAGCGGGDGTDSGSITSAGTLASKTLATTVSSSAPSYSVTSIAPSASAAVKLNANGQLAYSQPGANSTTRTYFYDGAKSVALPLPSGAIDMSPKGVSASGQVVGTVIYGNNTTHAFSWTQSGGLVDLGTLGGPNSFALAVSDSGQVVGQATKANGDSRPFAWTKSGGMVDLGTLGGPISVATAINRNSQVTGESGIASGQDSGRAFLSSTSGGMVNIHTLPNYASTGIAINDNGQVAGNLYSGFNFQHAFSWTSASGMVDLGTLGGSTSSVVGINSSGQITGMAANGDELNRAFLWEKAGGMLDLGTLGGLESNAQAINDAGQVVGGSTNANGDERGFVWSKSTGMVDLTSRLSGAPAGMQVQGAYGINNSGVIVATTNSGLVLLKPGSGSTAAPAIGAITAADSIPVNGSLSLSATFTDSNTGDVHTATIDWGDGSGPQAARVNEQGGAGTLSGSHIYRSAGVYTLTVKVTDNTGRSAETKHDIVAYDPAGGLVGGMGSYTSPKGAATKNPAAAGRADFRFASLYQQGASKPSTSFTFRFAAANLSFEANQADWLVVSGTRGQFEGTGRLNGAANYRFRVTAINANSVSTDRLHVQIWHYDATKKADVVDYDNLGGAGAEGSPVASGALVIRK